MSHLIIFVCKCFEFGQVQSFVIWLTLYQTTNFALVQIERVANDNFEFDENEEKFSKCVENTEKTRNCSGDIDIKLKLFFQSLHSTISCQTVYGICEFARICKDMPLEILTNIAHLALCALVSCVTSSNRVADERTNSSIQRSVCDFLWNNVGALCTCMSAIEARITGKICRITVKPILFNPFLHMYIYSF